MKTITTILKTERITASCLAKRVFYLAYRQSDPPSGMGVHRQRTFPTEDEVFENIRTQGDYPKPHASNLFPLYADYVFGRKMKLECRVEAPNKIVFPNYGFNSEEHEFAEVYPNVEALITDAAKSLNISSAEFEFVYKPKKRSASSTNRAAEISGQKTV